MKNSYKNSMKCAKTAISSSFPFIFPTDVFRYFALLRVTRRKTSWLVLELFYTDHLLHFFHLLEVGDDGVHVFHIVYVELDVSFE